MIFPLLHILHNTKTREKMGCSDAYLYLDMDPYVKETRYPKHPYEKSEQGYPLVIAYMNPYRLAIRNELIVGNEKESIIHLINILLEQLQRKYEVILNEYQDVKNCLL